MKILDLYQKKLLEVEGDTLANANLYYADLKYADLKYADLRSANLNFINLQYAELQNADLKYADLCYANLYHANLQNVDLRNANLRSADLRSADFQNANLLYADLRSANFSKTKLKGAILPDFDETPIIPDIHTKVYEAASAPNALNMLDWNTCGTTCCRAAWMSVLAGKTAEDKPCAAIHHWAGWVIALAGVAARALEDRIGTNAAAALIYMKSDPELEQVPNWFASNEEAIRDMRRLAA